MGHLSRIFLSLRLGWCFAAVTISTNATLPATDVPPRSTSRVCRPQHRLGLLIVLVNQKVSGRTYSVLFSYLGHLRCGRGAALGVAAQPHVSTLVNFAWACQYPRADVLGDVQWAGPHSFSRVCGDR
jgi:hypothetical protein